MMLNSPVVYKESKFAKGQPFKPLQIKTSTCANRVDPDEMAQNKPFHQDLHCLPFSFFF